MSRLINLGNRNLFDEFFRDMTPGYFIKPLHGDGLPTQIRVDITETPATYTVEAEIPGVGKDDIQVSIDGAVVTLAAEIRQPEQQSGDEQVLKRERYYGAVSRSFQLPQDVDAGAAKARYENGVLQLALPKKVQARAHRLAID